MKYDNVVQYLDAARLLNDIPSDRQLAKLIEVPAQTVVMYRKGVTLPSDATMYRLAKLAEERPELALLQLDYWRARHGAVKAIRKQFMERIPKFGAALLFGLGIMTAVTFMAPRPALALGENVRALYIMENI